MNETPKIIAERFSCRDFAEAPLTDEQIQAIAGAAVAVPSAMNRHSGRMIIPVGNADREQILKLIVKRDGKIVETSLLPVRFVPMVE